jgi:hypothetical protein
MEQCTFTLSLISNEVAGPSVHFEAATSTGMEVTRS